MFSYSSVVGMLIYLSGHTLPDIKITVNLYAQYMFLPMISHELALTKLVRYSKHNQDRGLVLDTNYDIFKVYEYPDANF